LTVTIWRTLILVGRGDLLLCLYER
jgi:hypothetical protein